MAQRLAGSRSKSFTSSRVLTPVQSLLATRGRVVGTTALAALIAFVGGCETDSFIDPSVTGRWENTPTIVPVLERIDVIERDTGEFVDVTPVMPEDLLPEATEYRVAPGDFLTVIILDFYQAGAAATFEQAIDPRGYFLLPQIGQVYVNKMTRPEVERAISDAVRDAGILQNALVEVQVPGARQSTFSIFGLVDRVGRYVVPGPDYRLLEALTDAGGVSPSIEKIFIIRQVPLIDDETVPGAPTTPRPRPTGSTSTPPPTRPSDGKNLIDLIDELTAPTGDEAVPEPSNKPPQTPSGTNDLESALEADDAENRPATPSVVGPGAGQRARASQSRGGTDTASASVMYQSDEPPIDLPDQDWQTLPSPVPTMAGPKAGIAGQGRWVFANGEWVQVIQGIQNLANQGIPEGEDPLKNAPKAGEIITQRVIEVPVAPLIQGVAQYNLVIRAGDAISVPGPKQGFVYLAGPGVIRPGVYQLPFTGKLTLQRLIASAGGLSSIAIPERVDLIRMVGDDRQATIRVNFRAIAEQTQPDIFLKPDDLVNVGTNFWATPLAVVRGGLRASYGFGFLLDRNFGNDVFGPPPSDDNRF